MTRNREAHANHAATSSTFFQVYPSVPSEIDLIDDGNPPLTSMPKLPRRIVVMGAIAEGSTEVLVVKRIDDVEVPIPIPWLVVGQAIGGDHGISAKSLLPFTVTALRHTGSGPEGLTLTGVPDANYELVFEITTSGALGAGEFRWSLDGGATWEEETVTLPSDGTHTLGSTGLTANFAAGDYVDGDLYEAETFVTTAQNIMVCW